MFTVKIDDTGMRYACQLRSEISKNHQGFMSTKTHDKQLGSMKHRLIFISSAFTLNDCLMEIQNLILCPNTL